jgi:hypothetical protein
LKAQDNSQVKFTVLLIEVNTSYQEKEHNLSQARTLFKQAADLEHAQNRLKGAALDYNNLAELERLEGSETVAKTYLEQAIRYAEEIEDEELKSYLQSKLK